jgi:hypothetical protein
MTMAKEGTRPPETVLAAIEEDLRRDEQIWKRIHEDLASLGAPKPRRTWRLVAAAAVALVLLGASFVVGRTTAPGPTPVKAPAVAEAATPFTQTGLESKREGFEARYGSIFGWGRAVVEQTEPGETVGNVPAAGPGRPKWGPDEAVNETAEAPDGARIPKGMLESRKLP